MASTVDALLPLSFLEAVRAVDRPVDDPDTEFVPELRNKRLGLSDTVHAQIRRYHEAVRRSQRSGADEVAALARLIGRRPDAEAVFRAAGQHLADAAYDTVGATTRRALRFLPGLLRRPLALRQLRRLARRYLGGRVERAGNALLLEVARPLTLEASPRGVGCTFYEAALGALLAHLTAQACPVDHVQCEERLEGRCQWRVEWRR